MGIKVIKRKVRFFFDVVVKSLTKFSYYKEIEKAEFSFSLKYLFFLFYLITLITSIIFSASIALLVLPKVPTFVATVATTARGLYPAGLIVSVKDGIVATNQKEPYFIDSLNSLGISKGYDHFITIDTSAPTSAIKDDKTMILVTKDSFVTIDNNNSYRVYKIDPTTNFNVDENSYNKFISQVSPYLRFIEPGLIALLIVSIFVWPFIGAGLSLFGQLIYLLIFSGLFFLIVKIMHKKIGFKKLYQFAMHASTLPILLGLVVTSVGIQMPFLLGTAILLVFMILVLNQFS